MKLFNLGLTLITLTTLSFSNDCKTFQNKKNEDLCKSMLEENIPIKYINNFINQSNFKHRDENTLKLIAPKEISIHRTKEKKANNNLLKHLEEAKDFIDTHTKVFDYVEKTYKVDREIITGILLKETILGTYKPKHDALVTLNTVYQETSPNTKRNKWLHRLSKKNLVFLAKHCFKNNVTPTKCNLPSSYIGAIGIPQFMPMNLYLARSFKNGTPDLTNIEDAIVSVGNYFNKMAKYKKLINWNKIPDIKKVEKEWYEYEFNNKKSTFSKNKNGLNCFSCDKKENEELNTYVNKIMRYNNSSNYAIGVFRLAWELHQYRKNN